MKLSSTITFGTSRSSSSSSIMHRVRDVAAVGVVGVDQDDRVGPLAADQLEVRPGSKRKSSSLRRTLKTTWVSGRANS